MPPLHTPSSLLPTDLLYHAGLLYPNYLQTRPYLKINRCQVLCPLRVASGLLRKTPGTSTRHNSLISYFVVRLEAGPDLEMRFPALFFSIRVIECVTEIESDHADARHNQSKTDTGASGQSREGLDIILLNPRRSGIGESKGINLP